MSPGKTPFASHRARLEINTNPLFRLVIGLHQLRDLRNLSGSQVLDEAKSGLEDLRVALVSLRAQVEELLDEIQLAREQCEHEGNSHAPDGEIHRAPTTGAELEFPWLFDRIQDILETLYMSFGNKREKGTRVGEEKGTEEKGTA